MKLVVVVVVVHHEYDGLRCVYGSGGVDARTVGVDVDVEGKRNLREAGNQSARADTWL
jgi:hypothetical protein